MRQGGSFNCYSLRSSSVFSFFYLSQLGSPSTGSGIARFSGFARAALLTFFLSFLSSLQGQNPQAAKYYESAVQHYQYQKFRQADSLFSLSIDTEPHAEAFLSRGICRLELKQDSLACSDFGHAALLHDKDAAAHFCTLCGRIDSNFFDARGRKAPRNNYLYYSLKLAYGKSSLRKVVKYTRDNKVIYVMSFDSLQLTKGKSIKDKAPEFKGGDIALFEYVHKELKVPAALRKAGKSGLIKLKLTISEEGFIKETEILEGLKDCKECETEALRLVQEMPPWQAAELEGKCVRSVYLLPISFR